MAWSYVLNGVQYSQLSVEGNAYANEETGLPAILRDIVGHVANAWRGVSTTSITVGTGTKSLVLSSPRSFAVGQPVRIAYTLSPTTVFMDGSITLYNETTGDLSVSVTAVSGSGTYSSWTVFIGFKAIEMASSPATIAQGGTGANTQSGARASLGLGDMATKTSPLALGDGGTGATTASAARTALGLGTAATLNVGTAANNIVQLTSAAKLPAVDGSLLTNLPQQSPSMPTGAKTLFYMAAAPTGWTQDTTVNDRVIRVVSTAGGGTGGAWLISGLSVASHSLTVAEMPAHDHLFYFKMASYGYVGNTTPVVYILQQAFAPGLNPLFTSSEGSGTAHTHNLTQAGTWRPSYIDVMVCTKN